MGHCQCHKSRIAVRVSMCKNKLWNEYVHRLGARQLHEHVGMFGQVLTGEAGSCASRQPWAPHLQDAR